MKMEPDCLDVKNESVEVSDNNESWEEVKHKIEADTEIPVERFLRKRPLKESELLQLLDEGLSDIDVFSDDNDDLEDCWLNISKTLSDDESLIDEAIPNFEPGPSTTGESTRRKTVSDRARIDTYFEVNELTKNNEIKWRKNVQYHTPHINWHENEVVQYELESPLYFFSQYFPDELFERMSKFTNLYGVQQKSEFALTNMKELKTFVGIHIIMGNLHYPKIKYYWEPKLCIPDIANNMPVNRFCKLRQYLHFVDVDKRDRNSKDKFWKVRPLFDTIRARCLSLPLENKLSIDEKLVPLRGQLNLKQYVKGKPYPWGIKMFALCGTSGTMYDFVLYQGLTTELNPQEIEAFGLGASLVLKLSERITEPNFQLYYNDFFSNYNLLQNLKSRGIYAAGVAQTNRFRKPPFSSDIEMKKKPRGTAEQVISSDGDIIMTKWYDNKSIIIASNYLGFGNSERCRVWDKTEKVYIPRPEVVKNYLLNKGGVEKFDFLSNLYRTSFIRSKRWTLRMFTHAIDMACVNGWLEYKSKATILGISSKNILDLLHFRVYISEALIYAGKSPMMRNGKRSSTESSSPEPPKSKRSRPETKNIPEVRLDNIGHLPVIDDKKHESRCKFPKCKFKTHFTCQKCNVHLCIHKRQNCFNLYHTK